MTIRMTPLNRFLLDYKSENLNNSEHFIHTSLGYTYEMKCI